MPALAQTMSTIASTAPTSWKWILSTGTLWILASDGAKQIEGVDGEVLYGFGERSVVDEVADDGEGAAVGVWLVRHVVGLVRCVRVGLGPVGMGVTGFVEVPGAVLMLGARGAGCCCIDASACG